MICVPELTAMTLEGPLCRPRGRGSRFTVDAEESERLEMSLDIIGRGRRAAAASTGGTGSAWRCKRTASAAVR